MDVNGPISIIHDHLFFYSINLIFALLHTSLLWMYDSVEGSLHNMAVIARRDAFPALTPDYLSYTVAPRLLAIEGTLTGLAVFAFILRVYVRASMLRIFGTDDYLMLAAVVCILKVCHRSFVKIVDLS